MKQASKHALTRDEELLALGESVSYKEIDGGADLRVHLFFPPEESTGNQRTALVYFCGGGWDGGRITQFAPQALHFAQRGTVSVLAEYRTRSSHGASPIEAMQDARSAFRWLRHHAAPLGIDPTRIVGLGTQAGAHIAAAAAMKTDLPEDDTDPPGLNGVPNALALLSPLLEVTKGGYGYQAFAETGTPLSAAHLASYAVPDLPPMLIIHGTRDRFAPVRDVVRFVKKMQEKENVCDLIPFEGRQHHFFNLNVDPASYDECNATVDRFLVHLGFLPESAAAGDGGESVRVIS